MYRLTAVEPSHKVRCNVGKVQPLQSNAFLGRALSGRKPGMQKSPACFPIFVSNGILASSSIAHLPSTRQIPVFVPLQTHLPRLQQRGFPHQDPQHRSVTRGHCKLFER
jgi:hypothetical protein